MAQAKVTNFFKTRKGTSDIHASKRRKVQSIQDNVVILHTSLEENTVESKVSVQPLDKSEIIGNLNVPTVNKQLKWTEETEVKLWQ